MNKTRLWENKLSLRQYTVPTILQRNGTVHDGDDGNQLQQDDDEQGMAIPCLIRILFNIHCLVGVIINLFKQFHLIHHTYNFFLI